MVEQSSKVMLAMLIAASVGAHAGGAMADEPAQDKGGSEQPSSDAADEASGVYLAALATTTLAYRPPGERIHGPQRDITPGVGAGYFVTETVALELDVGATFVEGAYVATAFAPGVVWAFHPNVYAAGRFIVPVDPETNFILYPGVGVTHIFDNGLAPFVEANALSAVGRGDPDFGATGTLGLTYAL